MARVRSAEKQQAILQSAVREIAAHGLGASTAKIAKGAGLAEGTIFTYFTSKDDLLNQLYASLKFEVYGRINEGFPQGAELYLRARHIWTEHLRWAMEKPQEQRVSLLLSLAATITPETRKQLDSVRDAVTQTMEEVSRRGTFRDLPPGFASSAMLAMQDPVLEWAGREPEHAKQLVHQAFDAFWKMAQ